MELVINIDLYIGNFEIGIGRKNNQVLKAVYEGHQIITVACLGDDEQPFFVSIMEDKLPPKRKKAA